MHFYFSQLTVSSFVTLHLITQLFFFFVSSARDLNPFELFTRKFFFFYRRSIFWLRKIFSSWHFFTAQPFVFTVRPILSVVLPFQQLASGRRFYAVTCSSGYLCQNQKSELSATHSLIHNYVHLILAHNVVCCSSCAQWRMRLCVYLFISLLAGR